MQPIGRRRALQIGGLGLVSAAFGATGLTWQRTSPFALADGGALSEPQVLRSAGGSLKTELTAARGRVRIAGADATALSGRYGCSARSLCALTFRAAASAPA